MALRRPRRKLSALGLAFLLCAVFVPQPAAAHGTGGDVFLGTDAVYDVAWNPEGTLFAVATAAGDISLIDGIGHVRLKSWHAVNGPINEIVFSPDGSKIAAAS